VWFTFSHASEELELNLSANEVSKSCDLYVSYLMAAASAIYSYKRQKRKKLKQGRHIFQRNNVFMLKILALSNSVLPILVLRKFVSYFYNLYESWDIIIKFVHSKIAKLLTSSNSPAKLSASTTENTITCKRNRKEHCCWFLSSTNAFIRKVQAQ